MGLFKSIGNALSGAFNAVRSVFSSGIGSMVSGVLGGFTGFGGLGQVFGGLFNGGGLLGGLGALLSGEGLGSIMSGLEYGRGRDDYYGGRSRYEDMHDFARMGRKRYERLRREYSRGNHEYELAALERENENLKQMLAYEAARRTAMI